jgi:hypothetical protein
MAATNTAPKKKSTAKTATATRKSSAKKTTAKRAPSKRAPKKPALVEREPLVVLEDAGYAIAGVASDVVEFAKVLPSKVQGYRGQLTKTADEAPERVKHLAEEAPEKVRSTVTDVRERLTKDVEGWMKSFEKNFDKKAAEGRKVAEQVKKDERVQRILDQTAGTRSQVKGAVTSVVKTADVTVEAGKEAGRQQAETATRQVKGAATSVRKSGETIADAAAETAGH